MSTPGLPQFSVKSFWAKKEGKAGAAVLLATGVAGLYGASLLLPWAIAFATDMLHLAILCAAFAGVLYVVFNPTFRSLVSNVFKSSMRFLVGQFIEIDPIGILKNTIDKMEEKKQELDKGLEGCAGAKRQLENTIASNNAAISHAQALINQCDAKSARETEPLLKQGWTLRKNAQLLEVGRRVDSNKNLQKVLDQTNKMYQMLIRWQQLAEYNIENTKAEVSNKEQERKSILASFKALGPAQRLIKGDDEQMKLFNASLEHLAEDNAAKLGAMEDFSRYSEKFLSNMDLEQGASAADAEKMLADLENRMVSVNPGVNPPRKMTLDEPVAATQAAEHDYLNLQ